jgi:hypothetical protein
MTGSVHGCGLSADSVSFAELEQVSHHFLVVHQGMQQAFGSSNLAVAAPQGNGCCEGIASFAISQV